MGEKRHDPMARDVSVQDDGVAKSQIGELFLHVVCTGGHHGEPRVGVEEVEHNLLLADELHVRLGVLYGSDGGAGAPVEQNGPVLVLVRIPVPVPASVPIDHLVNPLAHDRNVKGRRLHLVAFHARKCVVYGIYGICKF